MDDRQSALAEERAVKDAARQFGVTEAQAKKALGPALKKMAKVASELTGAPVEAKMSAILGLPAPVLTEVQRRMQAELAQAQKGNANRAARRAAPGAFELARPRNKFI
jgi:ParB-like chromosome segregation protein Spo0J